MMPKWTVHRLNNGLGEHAVAWDDHNLRLFNAHPMLDSRFVDGLLKHFGDGTERLCVMHINGQRQAMCLLRPKGFGVWATFLPSQTQIGLALIKKPAALVALMRRLPGFVGKLDLLCNDPAFVVLPTVNTCISHCTDHALTMNVSLDGDFDSYWNARSKNLAKNIARYERPPRARMTCYTYP